ncbi:MAG TPA: TIR domain-containing protein [Gemmatimonadales bacterium]|nr:TIR domain-containing protein [Gemmatimonadales bacterium]
MSDIFLSYKREDQGTAKRLAEALEARGWSVWWDPRLQAGERFDDVIEKTLQEVRCVVVLWSARSIQSQYVKDEASYALKLGKLVPAAIETVEPPFRFQGLHTIDLSGWDGAPGFPALRKLAEDLSVRLGAPQPAPQAQAKWTTDEDLARAKALVEQVQQTFAEREVVYNTELEDPEAERLRQRAAAGDMDAAFDLGVRYRNGQGVPKNLSISYDWLHRARISGLVGAKALLKKVDQGKV